MFASDLENNGKHKKNTDTHKLNNAPVEIQTVKCIQNESIKENTEHTKANAQKR